MSNFTEGLTQAQRITLASAAMRMQGQCMRFNAIEPYDTAAYDACNAALTALLAVLCDGDTRLVNRVRDYLMDNTTWSYKYGYTYDMTFNRAIAYAKEDIAR